MEGYSIFLGGGIYLFVWGPLILPLTTYLWARLNLSFRGKIASQTALYSACRGREGGSRMWEADKRGREATRQRYHQQKQTPISGNLKLVQIARHANATQLFSRIFYA